MDNQVLKNMVILALKTVYDPEIPVNIYELGLVYSIEISDDGKLRVEMTLTAPTCPIAGDIVAEVEQKLKGIPEFSEVKVDLVFDPPWSFEKMSDAAKLELGFM